MKTEQSEFEIAIDKLIEAHCRGEVVDDPKFKHYCELLNGRLERVKTLESEVARLTQEALDEHFAHYL